MVLCSADEHPEVCIPHVGMVLGARGWVGSSCIALPALHLSCLGGSLVWGFFCVSSSFSLVIDCLLQVIICCTP